MGTEYRSITINAGKQAVALALAALVAVFVVQVTSVAIVGIMPKIEGRFYPVVQNVIVDQLELELELEMDTEHDSIELTGSFEKIRDCVFLDLLVIYQTPDGGEVGVPVRFTEGTLYRGAGIHDYGPWEVDLSVHQFTSNTVVEAYHQCHPFWVTVTRFHPPR